MTDSMKYRKIESLSELSDGFYWWKYPEATLSMIVYNVRQGKIWHTAYETDDSDSDVELEGEWAGPIPTPEEYEQSVIEASAISMMYGVPLEKRITELEEKVKGWQAARSPITGLRDGR